MTKRKVKKYEIRISFLFDTRKSDYMSNRISIGKGVLWVLIWFGFMILYTILDISIWRKIAPILEEVLMRGFLLDGLSTNYGKIIALLISAALFSILHFNIAQIVPSFICGIILGLLYFYTDSIFSCILAHIGYNSISYMMIVLPIYINHLK